MKDFSRSGIRVNGEEVEAIAVIYQYLGQHGARLEVVSLHVVHLDFQSRE